MNSRLTCRTPLADCHIVLFRLTPNGKRSREYIRRVTIMRCSVALHCTTQLNTRKIIATTKDIAVPAKSSVPFDVMNLMLAEWFRSNTERVLSWAWTCLHETGSQDGEAFLKSESGKSYAQAGETWRPPNASQDISITKLSELSYLRSLIV